MNHHPVPTTEHLVELYERGQLGAELGVLHLREKGDDELFAQCCIEVHNAGAIDLTRVVYQPAFAALEPSAFFTAQQLYTQLIPEMEADPMALMGCVAALVDRSAGDLSAYFPERAFQNWCQRRVGQAQRIVELAREGHPLAMRFAGAALQGCGSVPQALSFISNFTDARQVGAVSALGQMQHDEVTAKQALAALRVLFDSEDDSLRARALSACFDVLAQHPSVEDGREVVATAALGAGPLTLYGLAALLNQGHSSLDPDGTDLALTAMLEVEAAHLGTKRLVDTALYGMLGTPRETLALDKLTQLSGAVKWTAEDLGDTMYALARGPAQRCHDLLVRWLLAEEWPWGTQLPI